MAIKSYGPLRANRMMAVSKSEGDAEENVYLFVAAAAKLAYRDIEIEEAGGQWGRPLTPDQERNAATARRFLDELRAAYCSNITMQR